MNYYHIFVYRKSRFDPDIILRINNALFFTSAILSKTRLWILSLIFWVFTLVCLVIRDIKSAHRVNTATIFYIILAIALIVFLTFRLFRI